MKILLPIILFFILQNLFAQNKLSDTTRKIPFDTNKIKEAVYLSNSSENFSYDSLYIWNDKRSLSEIMDERQGYFIYDYGLGGRNDINYNSRYTREVGIFRDGIQINDNFYQGFDIQNISVNEIERIEEISDISSFFYGINSLAKGINVITKDIFRPTPFSQLRYSQDREGSLFADVLFSQPLSRKFSFQLGITKHSLDGRYANSDFNIWRGRARINLFLSPKFNAKLNFYLNNYDRGLNDGLVFSPDKDSLIDPTLARVVHPSTKEKLENYYYDLTLTGKFFRNRNSLTKLKIYSLNSLRNLTNPDSSTTLANFPGGYFHSLLYGADLTQSISINYGRYSSSELLFGGSVYFNLYNSNMFGRYENKYYSVKAKYDFNYKNIFISALVRNDNIADKNFLNAGIESKFRIVDSDDLLIQINGGANLTKYFLRNQSFWKIWPGYSFENSIVQIPKTNYTAGGKIRYRSFTLSGEFFGVSYDSVYGSLYGANSSLQFISKFSDMSLSINYSNAYIFPKYFVKSDISYKDVLFRGKLILKTGFNLKYYNITAITNQYQTWYSFDQDQNSGPFPQKNQFIADFYIGARIGKANINLTIANIFNSLVYNAYLFPLDDRGGFGNVVSRFTIVWDFIN